MRKVYLSTDFHRKVRLRPRVLGIHTGRIDNDGSPLGSGRMAFRTPSGCRQNIGPASTKTKLYTKKFAERML